MKAILTILILAMAGNAGAILVPLWDETYAKVYHDAIAPEPILLDRIVLDYLDVQRIDIASLSIDQIKIVQIAIQELGIDVLRLLRIDIKRLSIDQIQLAKIGIDYIGTDRLTIFTFKDVIAIGTILRDAVSSVKAEHEITQAKATGDWTKVLARFGTDIGGKIQQLNEGKKFPATVGDFFVGADALSVIVFGNATVSFIDFGDSALPKLKDKLNTDKSIFMGIDYQYGGMELKKLLPYRSKIRGIASPWNFNNSIDLNPTQYQQAVDISRWLLRYSKAYMPEVPVFQLTAYDLDGWRQFQSHVDYDVDGYVLWIGRDLWDCRRYDWNEVKRVWESVIGKKPIVVAGILVNRNQELYLNELIEQLKEIGFAGVIYRVMQ